MRLDYREYSARLFRFFDIQPLPGETIATDGKVLRGSYKAISDDPVLIKGNGSVVSRNYLMNNLEPLQDALEIIVLVLTPYAQSPWLGILAAIALVLYVMTWDNGQDD